MEILPIRLLTDSDSLIFGSLSVNLGKLARADFPIASGFVISAPNLHLKTVLEHFDFSAKEVFEQTLTLVKKEIKSIPIPPLLIKEVGKNNKFLVGGGDIQGIKTLWQKLLDVWVEQIKSRIWREGFYKGVAENLEVQVVVFVKKIQAKGMVYFDSFTQDSVIKTDFGKLHPRDSKRLDEFVRAANKKLFMSYQYEWIVDNGIKITRVLPDTSPAIQSSSVIPSRHQEVGSTLGVKEGIYKDKEGIEVKSAIKIFADLSIGLTESKDLDGVFIASEKIYDLNKPSESFDNLVLKTVDLAVTYPNAPVLFKLADKSEGMGKVRGTLRLIHQKSLFDPLVQALDFARHKKGLTNVHIVIPFVRGVSELQQIKRDLAVKKLMRKNSLKLYLEIANPENIINLENYLLTGIDGVVINMDELIAHINGFDHKEEELSFYKNEISGLLKFLEDGIKLLHKSKIPILANGNITLNQEVLEFLIEKGVYGVIVQRYETYGVSEFLRNTERRIVLRRS